jgi:hypothetical protein
MFVSNSWLHLSLMFVRSSPNSSLLLVSKTTLPSRRDLRVHMPTFMLVGLMLFLIMFPALSADWLVLDLTVSLNC